MLELEDIAISIWGKLTENWAMPLIKHAMPSWKLKVTYNILPSKMIFHSKLSLDQQIWHEVDLLNGIVEK